MAMYVHSFSCMPTFPSVMWVFQSIVCAIIVSRVSLLITYRADTVSMFFLEFIHHQLFSSFVSWLDAQGDKFKILFSFFQILTL